MPWANRDVANSEQELADKRKELEGSIVNQERLDLNLEKAILSADDATKILDQREKELANARVKYGENSEQYKQAENNLTHAELNVKDANLNVKEAQERVMDNRELVIKQADEYEKSEEEHIQKANEASKASFDRLGIVIGGILGLLDSLIRKYKEWRDTKKDFDVNGNSGGARASGGSVKSGTTYLVGEEGPELFTPRMNGSIIPNDELRDNSSTNKVEQQIVVNAVINNPLDVIELGNILGQQLAFAGR